MIDASGAERAIAEGEGPVSQMLAPLLHLPSALIYRSLALVDVGGGTGALPVPESQSVPHALREPLVRWIDAPESSAEAVQDARTTADDLAARRSGLEGEAGRLDVVFRRAARRREVELTEVDDAHLQAERVASALETERDAVQAVLARFGTAAAARRAARPEPDVELVDHVEIFVGDPPPAELLSTVATPFDKAGDHGASAAHVVAGGLARDGRTPPLFWLGERPLPVDAIDRAGLWTLLGDRQPLLLFVQGDAPPDARPIPMVIGA
jgi:hypothetical protein